MNWNRLLVPADAGEFWTAASAILTFIAVLVALLSVRYAASALRLEQMPILNLRRREDNAGAELKNIGRGVAFSVLLVNDEGIVIASAGTLRPEDREAIAFNALGYTSGGFTIYAQDIGGRWYRTRSVYQGLEWTDGLPFANTFRGWIASWRVPRAARRRLRNDTETSWQYLQAISSPLYPSRIPVSPAQSLDLDPDRRAARDMGTPRPATRPAIREPRGSRRGARSDGRVAG